VAAKPREWHAERAGVARGAAEVAPTARKLQAKPAEAALRGGRTKDAERGIPNSDCGSEDVVECWRRE